MSKRKFKDNKDNLNHDFCDFLLELADYEKNVTRNIYKYNAYRQAAERLSTHPVRITSGAEAKKLPGIGEKISKKIDEFLSTGKLEKLQKIKNDDTATAINILTSVSGIGPAKAQELVEKGIRTIEDLEKHKDKLTHHQLLGLRYYNDFSLKIPRQEVSKIEEILKREISELDDSYLVTICGSYRRGRESSGDIDCLITHPNFKSEEETKPKQMNLLKTVVARLVECGLIVDTIASGSTKFMGVCRLSKEKPGRRLDIRLTPHNHYFCSILYFTGSDLFNRNMRAHAQEQGFTLNEYSLRPVGITGIPGNPVPISSEQEIFEYIDYPYKEPHERNI